MTEEEWDENDNLTAAMYALGVETPDRKMRLFVIACLHASRFLFPDDAAGEALRCMEVHAEDPTMIEPASAAVQKLDLWNQGTSPHEPILRAAVACSKSWREGVREYGFALGLLIDTRVWRQGIRPGQPGDSDARQVEQFQLLQLLRDIFGNPFRPVAFDPAWRTEHTTGLALRMYDERAFAAMPILADALEEGGCDNQDISTHCREPGVHVRGCWVVDLVLGKA